jgi:predicted nucleotidyltransferase component of viral defense system
LIPRDYITAWRTEAPWIEDAQVEQDLVICRALIDIFSHPVLKDALAFRGGTALYKLFLKPAARYSEDIDLVQVKAEPAGDVMTALRDVLAPWLDDAPRYRQSDGRVTFKFRFLSEDPTPQPLSLKVEINTREHFAVHGLQDIPFSVNSRWYEGACDIPSYGLNELLGTKLRALYQRRKGRDLFDLYLALQHKDCDPDKIIETFNAYMEHGGHTATRTQFADNLAEKLRNRQFGADIGPLLRDGYDWNLAEMAQIVTERLISRLPDPLDEEA